MKINKTFIQKIAIPLILCGMCFSLLIGVEFTQFYMIKHEFSYNVGDGYTVVCPYQNDSQIPNRARVRFSLDVSVFYEGTPIVLLNGAPLLPNAQGEYAFTATQDVQLQISGIEKKVSKMSGDGTENSPYEITHPIDLLYIAEQVNAGNPAYTGGYYRLLQDLDFYGEALSVIGDYNTEQAVFSGHFTSENNATVKNYVLNTNTTEYLGVFGKIENATVENLKIENFDVIVSRATSQPFYVGAFVGYCQDSTIRNCSATNGAITVYNTNNTLPSYVGGAVGYQTSMNKTCRIETVTNNLPIQIVEGTIGYLGGICGYSVGVETFSSIVINCSANGDSTGGVRSGGIVGYLGNFANVEACQTSGEVVSKSLLHFLKTEQAYLAYCTAYAGGIVGFAENSKNVKECVSNASTFAYALSGTQYQKTGVIIGNK